ncbi:MAG: CDP-diacylglycerol--serine O-phosphatidyltransferase [Rhodomicrobium sp.]|nr:MAG: CDP-diacylglycerol--serine O-phosphatidyltransferase [Rhodomicrobium sp.]
MSAETSEPESDPTKVTPAIKPKAKGRKSNGRGRKRFLLRRSDRRVPLRALIPNVITLMGLSAGLTSIRMAIDGRLELAIGLIVLAGALDGLDGRVARLLKASSKFGAELDSLADFVNFGVAPAILLFTWGLNDLKSFGWIAALAFSISAALRLARFNVSIDDPNKAQWRQKYFEGIPAPAGALMVMLPLYLYQAGLDVVRDVPPLIALYMVIIAGLMVSTLPSFSGKLLGHRIKFVYAMPLTVAGVLFAAILFTYPYITLSVICGLYLAALPLGGIFYRRDLAKFGLEGEI